MSTSPCSRFFFFALFLINDFQTLEERGIEWNEPFLGLQERLFTTQGKKLIRESSLSELAKCFLEI